MNGQNALWTWGNGLLLLDKPLGSPDNSLLSSEILISVRDSLRKFVNEADFDTKMRVAFGEEIDATEVDVSSTETKTATRIPSLAKSPILSLEDPKLMFLSNLGEIKSAWMVGDFTALPPIEVRLAAELNGANGAFAAANNRIYLALEFLQANPPPEAIAAVVLEEIGHWVDTQLNEVDSLGDEGEIFSALVRGQELDASRLQVLKTEDDTATITLDGQVIEVEQADSDQNQNTFLLVSIPQTPAKTNIKGYGPGAKGRDFGSVSAGTNQTLQDLDIYERAVINGLLDKVQGSNAELKLIEILRQGVEPGGSLAQEVVNLFLNWNNSIQAPNVKKVSETLTGVRANTLRHDVGSELSNAVKNSFQFSLLLDGEAKPSPDGGVEIISLGAKEIIDRQIKAQANQGSIDIRQIKLEQKQFIPAPDFEGLLNQDNLQYIIGGTQGRALFIKNFQQQVNQGVGKYTATLSFVIYDDFGVDDEDIPGKWAPRVDAVEALDAMWILQHHIGQGTPFIQEIIVDVPISGTFTPSRFPQNKSPYGKVLEDLDTRLAQLQAFSDTLTRTPAGATNSSLVQLFQLSETGAISALNTLDNSSILSNLPFLGKEIFNNSQLQWIKSLRERIATIKDRAFATAEDFKTQLNQILQPYGLSVTKNREDSNGVEFQLNLGREFNLTNIPLATDLGVPALGLNINGSATLNLDFDFLNAQGQNGGIVFGVQKNSSGEFDTFANSNIKSLSLGLKAGLSQDFQATGNLGFLDIKLTDDRTQPSQLGFDVVVDLDNSDGLSAPTFRFDNINNEINLDLTTQFGTDKLPSIASDLKVDFNSSGGLNKIYFENVKVDVSNFLEQNSPVIQEIKKVTAPIQPFIDALTKDITPISGFESVKSIFDKNHDNKITLVDFVYFKDAATGKNIDNFINAVQGITNLGDGLSIGTFNQIKLFDATLTNSLQPQSTQSLLVSASNSPLQVPILNNPTEVLNLLQGKDATLFTYQLPKLDFDFTYNKFFPLIGPLGINFGVDLGAEVNLSGFGFDTYGLKRFLDSDDFGDLIQGFYVSDRANPNGTGEDIDEIDLSARIRLEGGVNFGVAKGFVGGNIQGGILFDLNDPNDDGKVRPYEIKDLNTKLFNIDAKIDAGLQANYEIDLGLFSLKKEWDLANVNLINISLSDPPFNPHLGSVTGTSLLLHTGSSQNSRTVNKAAENEIFQIGRVSNSEVRVFAFNQQQSFFGIQKIAADGGTGNDTFEVFSDVRVAVQLAGGLGDDLIYGGMAANELSGGEGSDTLYGNEDNDSIKGGSENDTLYGGGGGDSLEGNEGDDQLWGQAGNDTLEGNAGNELLYGGDNNDSLLGNEGNDHLLGEGGNDTLIGGQGKDTLEGSDGDDQLRSEEENDTLSGGQGNDQLYGGDGEDSLTGEQGNDSLSGEAGNDQLFGQEGNDSLEGSYGNDRLYGQEGNNLLSGGSGDDLLDVQGYSGQNVLGGQDGNDTLQGGLGNDFLDGGSDQDTLAGSEGNDTLAGGAGNDLLEGEAGNDTLAGGDGADQLLGGIGKDSLSGDGGNDTLYGGYEADILEGGFDHDSLLGEEGNDSLYGGSHNDTLLGGQGDDQLYGSGDDDSLLGEDGSDELYGDSGNDYLSGGLQADELYGGTENDTLMGNEGVDLLYGEAGADSLNGGSENDSLYGGEGNDTLQGGKGDDFLQGDEFNDFNRAQSSITYDDNLQGGAGQDSLFGYLGNDSLDGGGGDDDLTGGFGNDTLRGGDGKDVFTLASGSGTDLIKDFNLGLTNQDNRDVILLSNGLSFNFIKVEDSTQGAKIIDLDTGDALAILTGITAKQLSRAYFDEENVPPNRLDFESKKPIYAVSEPVTLVDTVVRDANGINDLEIIDFWLRKNGGTWRDIRDLGWKGIDGSVAWGDGDGDGDLDVLLAGVNANASSYPIKIYRQNGDGSFTDLPTNLTGSSLNTRGVTWGDYDGDGKRDILGYNYVRRNLGEGNFSDQIPVNPSFNLPKRGTVLWKNFDSDSNLEILLLGTNTAKIYDYKTQTGQFQGLKSLNPVKIPIAAWGRDHNERYLLLADTQLVNKQPVPRTLLYRGSNFQKLATNLFTGITPNSYDFGDYNADGHLDLLLTGSRLEAGQVKGVTQLYRGNGSGTFTEVPTNLAGVVKGDAAWADFNQDGFLDFILTGAGNEFRLRASDRQLVRIPLTKLYQYDPQIEQFIEIPTNLPEVYHQNQGESIALADYDKNGKLDILLSGTDFFDNPLSKVYRNLGYGILGNGWRQASADSRMLAGLADKADVFVLDSGVNSVTINNFENGRDFLYLVPGLTFSSLQFQANGNHTAIRHQPTGKILATLIGVKPNQVNQEDFVISLNIPPTTGTISPLIINQFDMGKDFLYLRGGLTLSKLKFQQNGQATDILYRRTGQLIAKLNNITLEDLGDLEQQVVTERLNFVDAVFAPLPTNPSDTRLATFDYQVTGLSSGNYILKGTAYDHEIASQERVLIPNSGEPVQPPMGKSFAMLRGKIDAKLSAFYPFDLNPQDLSGHGNNGSVLGATLTEGFEGQAYKFNGLSNHIQTPVNINPSLHPKLTMGAWVRANVENPLKTIISHDNGGYDRTLGIDNRGGGLGWSAFSGPESQVLGFESVQVGEWTFVAAVYDQAASKVTLYVNDKVFTETGSLGEGHPFIHIGRNPSFGEFFQGDIDNVFIYDKALTAAEIANIRNKGSAGIVDSTPEQFILGDPTHSFYGYGGQVNANQFLNPSGTPVLIENFFKKDVIQLYGADYQYHLAVINSPFPATGFPPPPFYQENPLAITPAQLLPNDLETAILGKISTAIVYSAKGWNLNENGIWQPLSSDISLVGLVAGVGLDKPNIPGLKKTTEAEQGNIIFVSERDDFTYSIDFNINTHGQTTNETIKIDNGNDTLTGGEGNDTLISAKGLDYLDGGTGNDVLIATVTTLPTITTGVAIWKDYDNDTCVDIVLPNHKVYRNNKDGSFTHIGIQSGSYPSNVSGSIFSGDYDKDGDNDELRTNTQGQITIYRKDGNVLNPANVPIFDAQSVPLLGIELVQNGDGETGNTTGWSNATTGIQDDLQVAFTTLAGTTGLPIDMDIGDFSFTGGTDTGNVPRTLIQSIDVSSLATKIDQGEIRSSFSVLLRSGLYDVLKFDPDSDIATATLSFLNKNSSQVVVPLVFQDSSVNSWDQFSDLRILPSGTRRIEIALKSTFSGFQRFLNFDVAFFDNISLKLSLVVEKQLYGWEGNDRLWGGDGNDLLDGGQGNDRLNSGPGNDTLDGGEGNDRIDGGEGIDTLTYQKHPSGVAVNLSTSTAIDGHINKDSLLGIEKAIASEYSDLLIGNNMANELIGLAGNDTLNGGNGNDTLNGGAGKDSLLGGAGNDLLDGGGNANRLQGGLDNDTYQFDLPWMTSEGAFTALGGGHKQQQKIVRLSNGAEITWDAFLRWGFDGEYDKYAEFGLEVNEKRRLLGLPWIRQGTINQMTEEQAFTALGGGNGQQYKIFHPFTGAAISISEFRGWSNNQQNWRNYKAFGLKVSPELKALGKPWLGQATVQGIAGSQIQDDAGIDKFVLPTDIDLSFKRLYTGRTGLAQVNNDLVIDLNQDGAATATDDLWIKNFFVNQGYNRGTGFIETVESHRASTALVFDGVDDYVQILHSLDLQPQKFTLEAKVTPTGNGSDHDTFGNVIIAKGGEFQSGSFLAHYALNYVPLTEEFIFSVAYQQPSTGQILRSTKKYPKNQDYAVAATYDGSSLKLYVNGVLDTTVAATANTITYGTDTSPLLIGSGNFGAPNSPTFKRRFQGIIDEVRIWNKARTQAEIQAELERSKIGLVGYWTFEEGSGNTVNDLTNPQNKGTITGGAIWTDLEKVNPISGNNDILPLAKPFTPVSILFPEIQGVIAWSSSSDWADFDGDAHLDALVTGQDSQGKGIARIYFYDKSKNNFNSIIELEGLERIKSTVSGDVDNDGDLDLLLIGYDNLLAANQQVIAREYFVKICQNQGSKQFGVSREISLGRFSSTTNLAVDADWADFDNDGDLDIVTLQQSGNNSIQKLYHNNTGNFDNNTTTSAINAFKTIVINGLTDGSIDWRDYNTDGKLDLLLTGQWQDFPAPTGVDSAKITKVYLSDGAGSFTAQNRVLVTGITSNGFISKVYEGTSAVQNDLKTFIPRDVAWGDYNNDGYIDVLFTRTRKGQPVTDIYKGNPGGSFTRLEDDEFLMTSVQRAEATWGDYDSDGDLDIILSGGAGRDGIPFAQVYRNNLVETGGIPNQGPNVPEKRKPRYSDYNPNNNSVILQWNPATIIDTKSSSVTYNLKVGTTPGAGDILSPMSSGLGERQVAQIGNIGYNTSWTIQHLKRGETYYWNVQAIDQGWKGSNFNSDVGQYFTVNFINWTKPQTPPTQTNPGTLATPNLNDVTVTASDWGDYNDDGKLDLILVGQQKSNSQKVLRIYQKNADNSFTLVQNVMTTASFSDVDWGDYNQDGYLDVLVVGRRGSTNPTNYSGIYISNRGNFNFTQNLTVTIGNRNNNSKTLYSQANFGDYDNDGDQDVLLAGQSVSLVVENQGYSAGQYIVDNQGFDQINKHTSARIRQATWIDYDSDGDLDISLSLDYGNNQTGTAFYSNESFINETPQSRETTTQFSPVIIPLEKGLVTTPRGKGAVISWDDFNNDKKLDVLLDDGKVYYNIIEKANTAPQAPIDLFSGIYGTNVTLDWTSGSDTETPQDGLSYNLRVGRTPGGSEILAPTPLTTIDQGSLIHCKTSVLHNLPDGVYYWSVQTIDTAFAGSSFADERSFVIGLSRSPTPQNLAYPELAIGNATITEGDTGTKSLKFTVTLTLPKQFNSTADLKVNYKIVPRTANSGDYTATNGLLTFKSNEIPNPATTLKTVSKTLTVQVKGDTTEEQNETFYVNLSNPINATIKDFQGVGIIQNDDNLILLPDLLTTTFTAPTTVKRGDTITVSGTIKNRGDTITAKNPYFSIYLSKNQSFNPSTSKLNSPPDRLLASKLLNSPLGIGKTSNFQENIKIPLTLNTSEYGNYHLIVVADPNNSEPEKNEKNNIFIRTTPINITRPNLTDVQILAALKLADLVVSTNHGTSGKIITDAERNITVSWTVKNQGVNNSQPVSQWQRYIYLSSDDKLEPIDELNPNKPHDTLLLKIPQNEELIAIEALSPGESYTLTEQITIPNGATGNQHLFFIAYPTDQTDSNYNNNFTSAPITINSLGGNHTLGGGIGNDSLIGGTGNDSLNGGAGNDSLNGGAGIDTVVQKTNANLTLTNTSLTGNGTDSLLRIEKAELTGGIGKNIIDASAFTLGSVTLNGGLGSDTLRGGTGNDIMQGEVGSDVLAGGDGNDQLSGGSGYDTLTGGTGNDILVGGDGNDTLTGGTGGDRFTFTAANQGIDRIMDFSVVNDTIAVSATGFAGALVANAAITAAQFVIGANATSTSQRFIYNNTTGGLFFDVDGTGVTAKTQIATFSTGLAMTNNDIFVI
jgi:Ca2+-binding RTX toxin-like protein